jgi:hypothetical protein
MSETIVADVAISVDLAESASLRAVVDPPTTAANWLDGLETGWREEHDSEAGTTFETKTSTLPR